MNLSSLGSFTSLATNALDTARSTFKGLADAATDTGTSSSPAENNSAENNSAENKAAQNKAAQNKAAQNKRAETKAANVKAASKNEGAADTAETKVKGRFGSLLDSYA